MGKLLKLTPKQKARNSFENRLNKFVDENCFIPEVFESVKQTGMDNYDSSLKMWRADRKAEHDGLEAALVVINIESEKFIEQQEAEAKRLDAERWAEQELIRKQKEKIERDKRIATAELARKQQLSKITASNPKYFTRYKGILSKVVDEILSDPQLTLEQVKFFNELYTCFDREANSSNSQSLTRELIDEAKSFYKTIKDASAAETEMLKDKIPELSKLRGNRTVKIAVIIERLSWQYFAKYLSNGEKPSDALKHTINRINYEYSEI